MSKHIPDITTEEHLVTVEYTETVTRTALVRIPPHIDLGDPAVLEDIKEKVSNLAVEADSGSEEEIYLHGPSSQIPPGSLGSIDGAYRPNNP